VHDGDHEALEEVRRICDLPTGPYAVIHPGAKGPRRRWPARAFWTVADVLARDGLHPVITAQGDEADLAAAVVGAASCAASNLAGTTDLNALVALVRDAAVVVSNDTGVAHLAVGIGTPSVTVFQLTDPAR
jgi:ADP-heptose:LPS heptosyltransferase